jgi:cytochrome P450
MDLVADFARPLPVAVINDVLGIPPEDRDWLGEALAVLHRGFARQRDSERTAVQAANDATEQLLAYFAGLLDQRTTQPADDLMTALAARHAGGEDCQDLIANCIFFVLAGHQTTTTLLTLGAHLLCTHPSTRAALEDDPGRWPAAVEEMLRLITPTTFTGVTPRTSADIHGVACPAGQPRMMFLAAANRDPATFPDPDRFDIGRNPNPTSASPPEPTSAWVPPGQNARRSRAEHPVHPPVWPGGPYPARHHRQRPHPPDRPLHRHLATRPTSPMTSKNPAR